MRIPTLKWKQYFLEWRRKIICNVPTVKIFKKMYKMNWKKNMKFGTLEQTNQEMFYLFNVALKNWKRNKEEKIEKETKRKKE